MHNYTEATVQEKQLAIKLYNEVFPTANFHNTSIAMDTKRQGFVVIAMNILRGSYVKLCACD